MQDVNDKNRASRPAQSKGSTKKTAFVLEDGKLKQVSVPASAEPVKPETKKPAVTASKTTEKPAAKPAKPAPAAPVAKPKANDGGTEKSPAPTQKAHMGTEKTAAEAQAPAASRKGASVKRTAFAVRDGKLVEVDGTALPDRTEAETVKAAPAPSAPAAEKITPVSEARDIENAPAAPETAPTETVDKEDGTPAAQAEEGESEIAARTERTLSPGRLVLKRFFRSKLSMTGLIVLIVLFAFSFFGPMFSFLPFIWPEQQSDYSNSVLAEYYKEVTVTNDDGTEQTVYVVTFAEPSNYLSPSATHLLGTDEKGFDVFTRLMYGGRISLTVGLVVVILETLLGVILGGLAGYFGKWVDQLIMRIVDIFSCVPTMPMLMIVGVALQQNDVDGVLKLYVMMAFLTLFGWAGTARLVRGQILSLREQEFMISAEASGLPVWRKIFKHLIPNVMPQLIVSMTLGLGGIILTEATLGYLGIGLPDAYATWGNMINAAANNTALRMYPNLWISPGICIVLAVLAFNFVGDGLRDAFDPKARR